MSIDHGEKSIGKTSVIKIDMKQNVITISKLIRQHGQLTVEVIFYITANNT